MIFRVIGDTIELDGSPVATILPSVWATRRDYLISSLEAYDPDSDTLKEENEALSLRIAELEERLSEMEDAQ